MPGLDRLEDPWNGASWQIYGAMTKCTTMEHAIMAMLLHNQMQSTVNR